MLLLFTLVLVAVSVRQLPNQVWTGDCLLGAGLGRLPQVSPSTGGESGDITIVAGTSNLTTLVYEQGLLTVVALLATFVASAVGVVVLVWLTEKTFSKASSSASSLSGLLTYSPYNQTLAMAGLAGIDVLLALELWEPAFLTLGTSIGTWIVSMCLGAIGAGLQWLVVDEPPRRRAHATNKALSSYRLYAAAFITLAVIALGFGWEQHLGSIVYRLRASPVQVKLSEISQPMQDATISMEDGNYYQHHGFDWIAMHRALRVDLRSGKIAQGGSTISQQLAKNLFLTNDRTIARKIDEAIWTIELEHVLSKRRILELYLNTIDYGMGCHGIRAAALYYFHTTPDRLTLAQSAILVGLVPAPPQIATQDSDEPQYEDLGKLSEGQETALGRIAYFYPGKYSEEQISRAQAVPLVQLVYPYKDAWDRGATDSIPAVWHGVGFYFFADPISPEDIDNVSPCLLPHLATFLGIAHRKYGLVGIDHLGIYNDRGMRQARDVLSAHAYGQAIDISGFRFSDGSRIAVKDHGDPLVLARLLTIEDILKRNFDVVVDWKADPLRHQTHFHCEVRGPRTSGNE
jgi:hypothetical protein